MNRQDLRDAVARETGLSSTDAEQAVTALLDAVATALSQGEKVNLSGFGIFEVRERSARLGRNPQTGAEIQIAASLAPAFKPSVALKRMVSQH